MSLKKAIDSLKEARDIVSDMVHKLKEEVATSKKEEAEWIKKRNACHQTDIESEMEYNNNAYICKGRAMVAREVLKMMGHDNGG